MVYLPIVFLANEEQSLSGARVTENSTDALHLVWQAHAAQALGVTLLNVIAIEGPHLLTWRSQQQHHDSSRGRYGATQRH